MNYWFKCYYTLFFFSFISLVQCEISHEKSSLLKGISLKHIKPAVEQLSLDLFKLLFLRLWTDDSWRERWVTLQSSNHGSLPQTDRASSRHAAFRLADSRPVPGFYTGRHRSAPSVRYFFYVVFVKIDCAAHIRVISMYSWRSRETQNSFWWMEYNSD